jgi:phosphate-selective porin OprO and OprP
MTLPSGHPVARSSAALAGLVLVSLSVIGAPLSAQRPDARIGMVKDSTRIATHDLLGRIADLEAKLRRLEEQQTRHGDSLSRVARQAPNAPMPPLAFASADGRFRVRLAGYFQSDGRFFFDDERSPATGTFLLRRVRPVWEATVGRILDLRLMPDFGEGQVRVFDAHADLRLSPYFNVRSGKFKPPIGLERLQSATDLIFAERAHTTNFAPNRDVGIQLYGEALGSAVQYQTGLFNGVPDIGMGDGDNGNNKDVMARLLVEPLRRGKTQALRELGVGFAVSRGPHRGTVASPFLQVYRSPAQQPVFTFRQVSGPGAAGGTTVADGTHQRLAPQGYWYVGRVGTLWEYTRSSQVVRREATVGDLDHAAWNITSSFVLTGEHPSYRGLTPAHPFDPQLKQWGAFELGARWSGIHIDPATFPVFADPATQVRRAESRGVALNWYMHRGVRLQLNYTVTRYRGGALEGDREAEHALQTRIQHSF